MGIDIDVKLMLGVEYETLQSLVPGYVMDKVDDFLDNGDLDNASPQYDCPRLDQIIGVELKRECSGLEEMELEYNRAFVKLKSFGFPVHLCKIIATAHVS